jgi:dephospho-CoA kinase
MNQQNRKPIIGLVGGIGSGKSFVAGLFESLGCAIINADTLAQAALDEPAIRDQLVEWWGRDVLADNGMVDRKAMAKLVFQEDGNRTQLDRLESLVHPRVHEMRGNLREIHQSDPQVKAIVEDCPLLLEKQLETQCDHVVYVETDRATRLQRVAQTRGWTEDELDAREKKQATLDTKANSADYVVNNDAGREETLSTVKRVLSRILQEDI